jgi:Protein of unknown function (DUF4232)
MAPEEHVMITKARTTLAILAGTALLTTAGGTAALARQNPPARASAPAASAVRSTIPGCPEKSLSTGLHGSQVGLSNRGFILTLTNTSNSECSLYGYPGLGIEDSTHGVLPSSTHWGSTYFDTDPGPALIVLSPGETASADFAFFTGTGNAATYLEVTPPNIAQHLTVRIPGAPIQIGRGQLNVTAMASHTPY